MIIVSIISENVTKARARRPSACDTTNGGGGAAVNDDHKIAGSFPQRRVLCSGEPATCMGRLAAVVSMASLFVISVYNWLCCWIDLYLVEVYLSKKTNPCVVLAFL